MVDVRGGRVGGVVEGQSEWWTCEEGELDVWYTCEEREFWMCEEGDLEEWWMFEESLL